MGGWPTARWRAGCLFVLARLPPAPLKHHQRSHKQAGSSYCLEVVLVVVVGVVGVLLAAASPASTTAWCYARTSGAYFSGSYC